MVVDVSNSHSFENRAVLDFFRTSAASLLQAEAEAGVRHRVVLSVVGTDRLQESGYSRAEKAQEDLIKASGIPHSIVHATEFFEFPTRLAHGVTQGDTVRPPDARIQPTVSDDVATAVVRTSVGAPVNGAVEAEGPEAFQVEAFIRKELAATNDPPQGRHGPAGALLGCGAAGGHPPAGSGRAPRWGQARRLAHAAAGSLEGTPVERTGAPSLQGEETGPSCFTECTRRPQCVCSPAIFLYSCAVGLVICVPSP